MSPSLLLARWAWALRLGEREWGGGVRGMSDGGRTGDPSGLSAAL